MYWVMNPDLEARMASMSEQEFASWLFLEEHPDLPSQWLVNSSDPTFQARLGDVIRSYRAVAPFAFDGFMDRADKEGYNVAFLHDPKPTLDWMKSLSARPEVTVMSTMPGTVDGLFPFQVQAFNFAKNLKGAVLNHSTGTGKTVTAAALTAYHAEYNHFDLCLWVVKTHNRINTSRALKRLVGFSGLVIDGSQERRMGQYLDAMKWLRIQRNQGGGGGPVLVLNYEKFREDKDYLKLMVADAKVLIIWDEMPTRLRNRDTKLYKAVCEVLYTSKGQSTHYPRAGYERPSDLRQVMLSATPIENSPEDWFNCVRILDPTVYGSIQDFRNTYVRSWDLWNNPSKWHKLDYMGAKAAHITHQVDKTDPDIAVQFPKKMEDDVILELDAADRRIYDKLTEEYRKLRKKSESMLTQQDILAALGVFRMICNNPRAVLESAEKRLDWYSGDDEDEKTGSEVALKLAASVGAKHFTDEMADGSPRSAKLLQLHDDLKSGEKTVLFTAMNETTIPYITEWLDKWGVSYVTYHGGLTMRQRQAAEDAFKETDVQVFVSSDSGSDSINLEIASLCLHYDEPWKWSTKHQRDNRIDRITSQHKAIRVRTYRTANTVEERIRKLIEKKFGYHSGVLKGDIAEQSFKLRTDDYLWILTGDDDDGTD